MQTTYSDLQIVHQYVDEIAIFIQQFVEDENVAVVLACEVFESHKKRNDKEPFESEDNRLLWLQLKARNLAIDHLRGSRQNEKIKTQAIKKAIHDCP